ncbi:hypothetical protein EBU71_00045 [bacterium]|nr:hypothetical protein [Candidatus Elulimicrobium humile]
MAINKMERMMAIYQANQDLDKKNKTLLKSRKEVEINANGTSGYKIKEGKNKGKVVGHIQRDKKIID